MVSIIIPIYNVAPYVQKCIESVICQIYTDIECIIVNDCTTDNSIDICKKITDNYCGPIKFSFINHTQNRGLSAARNTGINAAKGDYIFFLDSDDWISPDCIHKMVDVINNDKSIEMVMGGITRVGDNVEWNHFLPKGIYTSNLINYACQYQIYTMVWNKLFNLKFIKNNQLFFKEGLLHEDVLWSIQTSCFFKKIASIEDKTYFYLIRNGSIQTNKSKEFHHFHFSNVKLSLLKFVFDKGFTTNSSLYYFITNDLPTYICCNKSLAKPFYYKFRECPYWTFIEQKRFGASKRNLLLSLNRFIPKFIGFVYYRLMHKITTR